MEGRGGGWKGGWRGRGGVEGKGGGGGWKGRWMEGGGVDGITSHNYYSLPMLHTPHT